jgi:hypothetical protein
VSSSDHTKAFNPVQWGGLVVAVALQKEKKQKGKAGSLSGLPFDYSQFGYDGRGAEEEAMKAETALERRSE